MSTKLLHQKMSASHLATVIGRGLLGSSFIVRSIPNSTWLLELDKPDDHETHVERHSKHFKKQRKPYLSFFVKKPWETFTFRASQGALHNVIARRAEHIKKNATCISIGKIQGEMHLTILARSSTSSRDAVIDSAHRTRNFFFKDQSCTSNHDDESDR